MLPTEHVIKNCPKQPSRFNHIHVEDHVLSAPPNPPNSQEMQEIQMEMTGAEDSDDEISESVSSETVSSTPDLYSGAFCHDLFAEPNDPHFPQLNLETQRLKKSLRQSKIQTKINHNLKRVSPAIKFLQKALKQTDVWRKQHPRSREFTWFNSDFSIASRLDKFYIS